MKTKIADRYLKVDPWQVIEEGFDPARGRLSESMFCLANEFMGVRGYFDEGYSGDRLQGSYFNNLYEVMHVDHPQLFKGIVTRVCFGVNSVDWLYTRISVDGEVLDLATAKVSGFMRRLDMRSGVLTREFVWTTAKGKQLKLTFVRLLSMVRPQCGYQRMLLEPLNFSGQVKVLSGLDFSILHEIAGGWKQTEATGTGAREHGKNFWTCPRTDFRDGRLSMLGQTLRSGHYLFAGFDLETSAPIQPKLVEGDQQACLEFSLSLTKGQVARIDKRVGLHWEKTADAAGVWQRGLMAAQAASAVPLDTALTEQHDFWSKAWEHSDIGIEGDAESQQGVRFSIFNLQQTYHGYDAGLNIPCKGLTAEVYYGEVFWDTETYCLPYYMFNNPQAARHLLLYRHKYLPQACERARELGLEGARYPMCTLDGTESCATWQHGDFEIHVSVAVAYAIWHYAKVCGDADFLHREGIEMLLQICRFYAAHGAYSPRNGDFGLYGVMGPDEYHMNVNNNCYTNVMVKKAFEYTLAVVAEMKKSQPERLAAVAARVALRKNELGDWRRKAAHMRIPYDQQRDLYEQHDGYFDLPEVDVKNFPESEIPVYQHWPYVKIFRYNMIKQPDVLLLPLFFSGDYPLKTKRVNYEYYEARTIHESSLSPGVHSILAAELGKTREAWEFFTYMVRLDLDNYNRNTAQGLHVTSMSGAWLNMVYGWGGLRTDGDLLSFNPSIPRKWQAFRFRLRYRGSILEVAVNKKSARFRMVSGADLKLRVYGRQRTATTSGFVVKLFSAR
ncbi:MAG: family 65 glycosyl hydrolase [Kiritimatiellaeota bacterium]|nr:family 65 glycosyl hydrolase [Kiritimatiellota bacterium]